MDWWATSMGGQRGAFPGTVAEQAATCGAHLDAAAATIFDPWLSTDDLDLGAILNQAGCATTVAAPAAGTQAASTTLAGEACAEARMGELLGASQQHQHSQQNQLMQTSSLQANHNHLQQSGTFQAASQQSRSPADNKRHIISIINNSAAPAHPHHQHHPQLGHTHHQQSVMGMCRHGGGGSVAGSPISSSLGSSPLNNQAAYLSSPHSSLSPPSTTTASALVTTTAQIPAAPATPLTIKQAYGEALAGGRGSLGGGAHQSSYFPECYIIEAIEGGTVQSRPDQPVEADNESYSQTDKSQSAYQDGVILMARPPSQQQQQQQQYQHNHHHHHQNNNNHNHNSNQQQLSKRPTAAAAGGRAGCAGSSLLSPLSAVAGAANQKQATKSTTTKRIVAKSAAGANSHKPAVSSSGPQPQKARRCRNITDYVLAEEEKRLLIKEGHADFPMNCQARPLTKAEERILRKVRRKIRNKKSAQCSRQRKKEYVEELERKYNLVLRENEELRQLLAGDIAGETKFAVERLDAVPAERERESQRHHPSAQQQQAAHFGDADKHRRAPSGHHQDQNFHGGDQSASSMDQMSWKDLFPQAQQHQQQRQHP